VTSIIWTRQGSSIPGFVAVSKGIHFAKIKCHSIVTNVDVVSQKISA
jgi:hypothetical protein